MRDILKFLMFVSAVGVCTVAKADLSTAQTVFKSGNWSVLRDVDAMTDKTSCTGIYKDDKGVQLTGDALYVRVKGGLKSVTLRFGEQPAEPMRLPNDSEKSVDAVAISGDEFRKLLASDRLRLQSLTLVRGIASFDLNLDGLVAAHENIQQGCPGQTLSKPITQKILLCGDTVLARLRERNVAQDVIEYTCSPR